MDFAIIFADMDNVHWAGTIKPPMQAQESPDVPSTSESEWLEPAQKSAKEDISLKESMEKTEAGVEKEDSGKNDEHDMAKQPAKDDTKSEGKLGPFEEAADVMYHHR